MEELKERRLLAFWYSFSLKQKDIISQCYWQHFKFIQSQILRNATCNYTSPFHGHNIRHRERAVQPDFSPSIKELLAGTTDQI